MGQFSGTIPIGGFVQQPGTNVFQYQDSTGLSPYRVSSLSLDLDAQTFTAQASGIALAGLPNPFSVTVGTDQGSGCIMARVEQADTGTYQLSAGDGVGEPCAIPGIPVAEPPAIPAGSPANVTVYASMLPGAGRGPQNIQPFRADGDAQPVGDPLCTLTATDGQFSSCTVSFNEPNTTTIPLLVQATGGSQTVLAPGFSLQVTRPIADADAAQISAIQGVMPAARQTFTQFGDSVQSRALTLTALRGLLQPAPGLTGQPVGPTPGGLSIGVRTDIGLVIMLVLNDLQDVAPDSGAVLSASATMAPNGLGTKPTYTMTVPGPSNQNGFVIVLNDMTNPAVPHGNATAAGRDPDTGLNISMNLVF